MDTGDAVTAEEMQSIIDASDTGMETYPRHLAANLAISDAEGLEVSHDQLKNLIDTLPPQGQYSTVTEAIENMQQEQLEDLYRIMQYHKDNPQLVSLDTVPDMESEVSPLMEFIDGEYQELTGGESIEDQINQAADVADGYDMSAVTETPAGMSEQELLQYAQENLSEGEVFQPKGSDSAYVFVRETAESLDVASDQAESEARDALSGIMDQEGSQASYLEQRAVSETADGQQVGVLMELPLN